MITIGDDAMSETEKKLKTGKRSFILALILLLMTNIIMGTVLMVMSRITLREQIDQRMLDIANTAAYQLNGDELEKLTADDKETESYQNALHTLSAFQENIQLDYIYGIRAHDDGTFTFTIDPTVNDPGEFGAPIIATEALRNAAKGYPSVDKEAYSDSWGRFYSAYSPVFDSKGNVAGIVGVDFNADWYDGKLNSNRAVATFLTLAALIAGIILSYVIMSQNRRQFSETMKSLERLDKETQRLDNLILRSSIKKLDYIPDSDNSLLKTLASGETAKITSSDEYSEMNTSIESVYKKLKKYLKYIDSEVYTDVSTGLSNKIAYKNRVKSIIEKMENKSADFSVIFFYIIDMREIYTNYGYEIGDSILFECASMIKNVFDKDNTYHIMGSEFIVIAEGMSKADMMKNIEVFNKCVEKFNENQPEDQKLLVSGGSAVYDPDKHESYRKVFIEAKKNSDVNKN